MKNTTEKVDPVVVELIKGAFRSARSEMEALIDRTSMSPFIREKKDYFSAFFDRHGQLISGTRIPLAVNLIDCIFGEYPIEKMSDGDLYIYNDPYWSKGAVSHLPDMVFVAPVFDHGEVRGFAEAWGHLWDIGGLMPGSISPDATETFHEGILVPPTRISRAGEINVEVMRMFLRNSRFPEMVKGDLNAIMACCQLGKRRFEEILQRFGREVVERASEVVLEQTAATLRRVMAEKIPDGTFSFTDYLDSDGVSDNSYSVALTLKKSTDQISMDFAKSGDQAIGAINFKMDKSVPANMMGLLLTGDEPGVEMNSGFSRAIDEVILRPGSIVDPLYPAPVGMRAHTMVRVTSTLLGVIGQATEGQMSAASPVYVLYYLRSHDRLRGSYELCIEGLGVGFGARTFSDGIDAVYFVAQKNYPVEFAEMEFGVRIEGYRIHEDSGGPGYYRGGAGIVRDVRVIGDEAVLGIRLDNVRFPAWGTNGGQAGGSGNVVINPGTKEERTLVPMSDQNRLEKGDLLRVMTSGGGGWGDPFTRPPETVLDDVLDGFVSIEKAHLDYGVIVTEDRDVDIAATEKLRQQRSTATAFVNRGSTEVPNVSNS
ncbi:MAG: methylhydantoinase [Myxococcales bacterium]|nr:methylhydantoinase [Myxococcales bacterium]